MYFYTRSMANNGLVLTLPARDNFGICARRKRLGSGVGCVLPVKARAGRTTRALALYLQLNYRQQEKGLTAMQ